MKKYTVSLKRSIYKDIEIEADSEDDAYDKAQNIMFSVDFQTSTESEDTEITDVS